MLSLVQEQLKRSNLNSGQIKRFRIFAGPNGSGKSFLVDKINKSVDLGYLINADNVKDELNKSKFLDCNDNSTLHQGRVETERRSG